MSRIPRAIAPPGPGRPARRILAGVVAVILACGLPVVLGGCGLIPGAPASMSLTSRVDPARRVQGTFNRALYGYDSKNRLTIVLTQGDEDAPTRAVTIRMFWQPAAGSTPISPDATNASIQYLVFGQSPAITDAEPQGIGIYDGAGYLYTNSTPGASSLSASVWQSDLRLRDASEQFTDQLGQATFTGDLTARRDDQAVLSLLRKLSTRATDRLGYPRLIDAGASSSDVALARRD